MDRRMVLEFLASVTGLGMIWLTWRTVVASRFNYVIGRDSFRVMIGRLTLRRIRFADISSVRMPRRDLRWMESENWRTTYWDAHRMLVLERKSGVFRKFTITPKHRYAVRSQLREAIAKSTGQASLPDTPEEIAGGKAEGELSSRD